MKPVRRKAFVLGATAAAAMHAVPARAQTPAGLTTLRLGTASGDDTTPIVYGMKAGIFAKYGLDLQIGRISGPTAAALLGGTFDLGKSVITTLLQAHEKDLPLTVVAAAAIVDPKQPFEALLLRKESMIRSGKDFNNQLVGVGLLQSLGSIALQKWVDEHGGDSKTIKFVEIPLLAAPAAVEQGRVFASESTQPTVTVALESGRLRMDPIINSFVGTGCILTAWATTKDFSTQHPDVIRAFARAYRESATYVNAHHSETIEMMAAFTSIDAAIIAKMPRAMAGPTFTAAQIQPIIEMSAQYGALKRSFPAAELIDPNIK